jgi:hypothetical protein
MPGAGLTELSRGKAPSDRPALKPYWGKPAVRNFREDDGNVGIIRSPVRAIVLPGVEVEVGVAYGSWAIGCLARDPMVFPRMNE